MPLIKQTTLYEVLARFNEEGLQGCHRVDLTQVIDTDTNPPTLISATVGSAVELTQEEASDLIGTATLAPLPEDEIEALEAIPRSEF